MRSNDPRKGIQGSGLVPYSSPEGKPWAKAIYDEVLPLTVVDVGPGAGRWKSLLAQEGSHWTAVEIFAPYVSKFKLKKFYDIERERAVPLLDRIKTVADNILLATPVVDYPQGPVMNNVHETHVDQWDKEQMDQHLPGARYTEGDVVGTWWWTR